jgi:Flp pilus assembly protein CpaB
VKKKPNFIPFILAGLLFFVAVAALWHWQAVKNQQVQAAVDAQKAADAAALAAAQEHQVSVTPTPTNMRNVLYATQPVEPGNRISPAFYEMKLTPLDILPDAFTDKDDVTGMLAVRHIEKGDPLTPRNVGRKMPSLSTRIAPGMRAVSLPIFNGDANETGGFVVDGDHVDLLYTVASDNGGVSNGVSTQTILQNLKIAYIPGPPTPSDQMDGITPVVPAGGTVAVTFECTPEEAQELVYLTQASKRGVFSMILRSTHDDNVLKIKPFAIADYDPSNLRKIQQTADKSVHRVEALRAEIEAKEKQVLQEANETNTPPPSP